MQRVLFEDVVPYDTPSSLATLHGPQRGVLVVPKSVYWGPDRQFDLGEHGDRVSAYQALIRDGSQRQQEALLNAAVLTSVWLQLALPRRCRQVWEERFPELAAQGQARARGVRWWPSSGR